MEKDVDKEEEVEELDGKYEGGRVTRGGRGRDNGKGWCREWDGDE